MHKKVTAILVVLSLISVLFGYHSFVQVQKNMDHREPLTNVVRSERSSESERKIADEETESTSNTDLYTDKKETLETFETKDSQDSQKPKKIVTTEEKQETEGTQETKETQEIQETQKIQKAANTEAEVSSEAENPEIPIIKLKHKTFRMTAGDDFKYLNQIKDIQDDKNSKIELFRHIIITHDYDVNTPGEYEIIYRVMDLDNHVSKPCTLKLIVS